MSMRNCVLATAMAGVASADYQLKLLHMNDHHSHLDGGSFTYDASALGLATENAAEIEVAYGGAARLVSTFQTLKAASPHTNVLKLHAGDAMTGTSYYSLFGSAADASFMTKVCFDAFCPGNHEFDDGDAALAKFLEQLDTQNCTIAATAANIVPHAASALLSIDNAITASKVFTMNGQRVGVVGIDIKDKTMESSRPDAGTILTDELTATQTEVDVLTAAGVDKIVLLSHVGIDFDVMLAAGLSGVDVIVGGDSHTLLSTETAALADLGFPASSEFAYPAQKTDKDGNTVCVYTAWEYAHTVGNADITFDDNGHVTVCAGTPVFPIDHTGMFSGSDDVLLSAADAALVLAALEANPAFLGVAADEATTASMAMYESKVDELKKAVIGSVASKLCLERIPGQGRTTICDVADTYQYGSDITNLVAKAFMHLTPTSDIGIQNGGGVRVDVDQGNYTMNDAFTLLPFSNTIVTLDMTGAAIKQVLEDALTDALTSGGSGAYPYASGLRFDVDMSADADMRVSNLMINPRVASEWSELNLTTTYTVVTNNYIAGGKDGYHTFGELSYVDTYKEYAQSWIDYVTEVGTVDKLPVAEYSTQSFISADGVKHDADADADASAEHDADASAEHDADADADADPSGSSSVGSFSLSALAVMLLARCFKKF